MVNLSVSSPTHYRGDRAISHVQNSALLVCISIRMAQKSPEVSPVKTKFGRFRGTRDFCTSLQAVMKDFRSKKQVFSKPALENFIMSNKLGRIGLNGNKLN